MSWLNYHHLFYFWTVAREGSIARACDKLLLAQPTISGQLRALEKSLGDKLFTKAGRGLVLTDAGRTVYRYADEIFSLGRELQESLAGRPTGRPIRLTIGIVDALPKLIVYKLIEPAVLLGDSVQLVCLEGKPESLLAQLATYELDVVLSDAPAGGLVKVRAFSHQLGECGVTFVATSSLAAKHRRRFPQSLDRAPFLLPTANSTLRRALEHWFDSVGIRPDVRGEFDDSALLKAFGQIGAGLFAVPTVIEREVRRQYHVGVVGRTELVRERFYAVTVDRKLKHPAVVAICQAARKTLFS